MKKLVCIAVLALSTTVLAQTSQSVDQAARNKRAQDQSVGQQKVYTNDDFPDKPAPVPADDKKADSDAAAPTADAAKDAAATPSSSDAKPADAKDDAKKDSAKAEDTKKADATSDANTDANKSDKKDSDTTAEAKDKKKPRELKESDKDDKEKDAKAGEDSQAQVDAEWKGKIDAQKAKIAGLQREYDLTDREYKLFATSYYADAGNRLRDQKDFHDQETSFRDKLGTLKQQIADEQSKLGELQDQAHKAGANKAYD